MHSITLGQDLTESAPQRMSFQPRLRLRRRGRRTEMGMARGKTLFRGDVTPVPHTPTPRLLSHKPFLGPNSGVSLSASIHRLQQTHKIKSFHTKSNRFSPDLHIISTSQLTNFPQKTEFLLAKFNKTRIMTNSVPIRKIKSELNPRIVGFSSQLRRNTHTEAGNRQI